MLGRTPAELAQIADELGITVGGDRPPATADDWLNLLLAERVEPRLAEQGGVFVYDYPASQCALARVRPGSPPVAERFELYLNGVELCNGYQELTNADELERRMVRRIDCGHRPG
ncbi:MAG: amino acid--tRNA ligase-related protein [Planctomycetaceae bacterium]